MGKLFMADLNGDGMSDLICHHFDTGKVEVKLLDGTLDSTQMVTESFEINFN